MISHIGIKFFMTDVEFGLGQKNPYTTKYIKFPNRK